MSAAAPGIRSRVYPTFAAAAELRDRWNELVGRTAGAISGIDVTASYEWIATLWQTSGVQAGLSIVSTEIDGVPAAILPAYIVEERHLGIPRRRLHIVPNLYAGRSGFLVDAMTPTRFAAVLDAVFAALPRWDDFLFTVLDGSESDAFIRQYAAGRGLRLLAVDRTTTPYMALPAPGTDPLARLGKKLRYTIRNSEKKLREEGVLEFRLYAGDARPGEFLELMFEVERQSWKHEAGTAITRNPRQERFYRALATIAAQRGWLHAGVLLLAGEPIAHVYGLLYQGVFYDLKESFARRFATISPGHVLKRYLLTDLITRGVGLFDYMGRCEPYKLQWTDLTYTQTTWVLYNNTPVGRLLALKNSLARAPQQNGGRNAGEFDH